jgi:hypothetical protein
LKDASTDQVVPLEEVEARMRPGRFAQTGFLGLDERLAHVLEADARTVADLGLTTSALAEGLANLLEPAVASRRWTTRVGHYAIRLRRYKGSQICPFAPEPHIKPCPHGGGVRYASIDWRICNARSGQELIGPGLIVHLIGAHGFFEGPQSPFRVAPRALAQLLELGPFAPAAP